MASGSLQESQHQSTMASAWPPAQRQPPFHTWRNPIWAMRTGSMYTGTAVCVLFLFSVCILNFYCWVLTIGSKVKFYNRKLSLKRRRGLFSYPGPKTTWSLPVQLFLGPPAWVSVLRARDDPQVWWFARRTHQSAVILTVTIITVNVYRWKSTEGKGTQGGVQERIA